MLGNKNIADNRQFTVVGIVNGRHPVRVHDIVRAHSAHEALYSVTNALPTKYAEVSPWTTGFLAAIVFDGAVRCAHRGLINGPFGDDRCGRVEQRIEPQSQFTVVAIDPATRSLSCCQDTWSSAGTAERDLRFDFYLLASVLEGEQAPLLTYQQALAPSGSGRNERILAMLKYSPHFAGFFGTKAPMHMPG